jgi:hypothetical protein
MDGGGKAGAQAGRIVPAVDCGGNAPARCSVSRKTLRNAALSSVAAAARATTM